MSKYNLIIWFLILSFIKIYPLNGQNNFRPKDVANILKQSKGNRSELEKVIRHFERLGDTLKLKAAFFLIGNMDIHYSVNYYWADSLNRNIQFDELKYSDYETALNEFKKLKLKYTKIHPVQIKYKDIDSIKASFLIDNIERAFSVWKRPWASHLSFNEFCEYILPYRVNIELMQNWRKIYQEKFSWVMDSVDNGNCTSAINVLNDNLKSWFVNTYFIENRKEPLPLLGPLQLLFRGQGPCEDMAGLGAYTLRSQGIPCAVDFVTYWATSTGKHLWNVSFSLDMKPIPFNPTQGNPEYFKIQREPAKVLRLTYAKQPSVLVSKTHKGKIPEGFLQLSNYIDVTNQYWKVKDIECNLFSNVNSQIVYACVLNYLNWRPAWWGEVDKGKAHFSKMGCGAIYLPMSFKRNKLKPVGYPLAIDSSGMSFTIIPDTINKHSITLKEQDKYLIYRAGKKYTLYYWSNDWIKLEEKIIGNNTFELSFNNVPRNALLIMVPEYSQRKERPFMISDSGERSWW